jgi:nucleoside 2-deoxyribosyltransferase
MSQMNDVVAVVGGAYLELCLRPHWREVFGSGGRAASALAAVGHSVHLHSYVDDRTAGVIESRAALEAFSFSPTKISRAPLFEYRHGLEVPRIVGVETASQPLHLSNDLIVRFGMLEGDAIVHGQRVVYDPQDAKSPRSFRQNGSTAGELAVVLNRSEAALLTELHSAQVEELAKAVFSKESASVVVIKLGASGAFVYDGKSQAVVPAYQSSTVWKIGSGDCFAAHFAASWLSGGVSAVECAERASRATSFYCETRGLPTTEDLADWKPRPVNPSQRFIEGYRPIVYLAGPFFTLADLWMVDEARSSLLAAGLRVFSPYHDVGYGAADDVVAKDLAAIETTDLMLAIADGMDPGTVYETGYARAKGKPVIVYSENEPEEARKMLQGSDCTMCDDFVTSVYQTLWTACAL